MSQPVILQRRPSGLDQPPLAQTHALTYRKLRGYIAGPTWPEPALADTSSLFPRQGADEFAAEVGDVGNHAAPDQVRCDWRRWNTCPTASSCKARRASSPGWCAHGCSL